MKIKVEHLRCLSDNLWQTHRELDIYDVLALCDDIIRYLEAEEERKKEAQ